MRGGWVLGKPYGCRRTGQGRWTNEHASKRTLHSLWKSPSCTFICFGDVGMIYLTEATFDILNLIGLH
jgi:hypothetical protein